MGTQNASSRPACLRCCWRAANRGGFPNLSALGRIRQTKVNTHVQALAGATVAEIADPAVVLVVGWVALECHSESGRHEQIRGKSSCTPKCWGSGGGNCGVGGGLGWQ